MLLNAYIYVYKKLQITILNYTVIMIKLFVTFGNKTHVNLSFT